MDDVTALESSNEAFSEWQELASEEVEASVEKVTFSTNEALVTSNGETLVLMHILLIFRTMSTKSKQC